MTLNQQTVQLNEAFRQLAMGHDFSVILSATIALLADVANDAGLYQESKDDLLRRLDEMIEVGGVR
jgi:hypothetical protein